MADEHSQRPYRSSETIARAGQAKPAATGNDPLAELARLIGQSDPFGEFNRENGQRAAVQSQPRAQEAHHYSAPPMAPVTPPPSFVVQDRYAAPAEPPRAYEQHFGQQSYDPAAYATEHDGTHYDPNAVPGYSTGGVYDPGSPPPYAVGEEDLYDDMPPSRRRTGIMVVAGIFALAVIGTAGAFGYRAVFGSSRSVEPPPVIKAETAPSKVVPAAASKDAQSNKLITDRVSGAQGEKIVSREETPVDRPPVVSDSQINRAPNGSGVVGSEPKRIRTIPIRPDQQGADVAPVAASTAPSASPLALMPDQPTRQVQTQRIPASAAPAAEPAPSRQTQARVPESSPSPVPVAGPPPSNAPLSLNPNAAPARSTTTPARTASVPSTQTTPAARGGPQFGVQVSSQRSEAEAQAAYRALESKFPTQLGGKPHFVYSVDLGAKGTYYRAMVGPFATNDQAAAVCTSLKSAGGSCIIQRN